MTANTTSLTFNDLQMHYSRAATFAAETAMWFGVFVNQETTSGSGCIMADSESQTNVDFIALRHLIAQMFACR